MSGAEASTGNPVQGDTLTICHKLSGDSGPKTERSIDETAWDTHAAHGDTKGECSGFVRVGQYSARDLKDFYITGDTVLNYLLTADALRVYRNDTMHRTVESDSTETLRLSKTSTIRAVRCDDRSTDFHDQSERALDCQLLNPDGEVSDTAYFPNHSHPKALLGERLLLSQRGEPRLYDFASDTSVWSLTGKVREIYPGDSYQYFLSVHTKNLRSIHELRALDTGELISSREIRAFHREISEDGSYLYLIESESGSRSKKLTVYNRDFERLAQWGGLPFHGEYNGAFSTKREEVYVPLVNGKLLVGDLTSGERRMKSFPGPPFNPDSIQLNHRNGLLFLYGIMEEGESAGFLASDENRRLIVFDTKSGEFLSEEVLFSTAVYNFVSTVATPRLRLLNSSHLALQHPNKLEVYRYRFD